jgi:hypothetical protein
MSEHQKETAFLQRCLGCDNSAEHQALDSKITQLQRDERCVGRAVWLMGVLTTLAVAGVGYAAILIEAFPWDTSHLMVMIVSTLGLTSIICLMAFAGLRMVYRLKLNERREEGRQLVTRLLGSCLGRPGITSRREDPFGAGNCETVQVAAERNLPPEKPEPAVKPARMV